MASCVLYCRKRTLNNTDTLLCMFFFAAENPLEAERRVKLLERLADCCAEQGSYHLATKKYTQAGNKAKVPYTVCTHNVTSIQCICMLPSASRITLFQAMKALLKSGDTEKIVFFAGVSQAKGHLHHGCQLPSVSGLEEGPRGHEEHHQLLHQGRAMESLAGFYDACAQVGAIVRLNR